MAKRFPAFPRAAAAILVLSGALGSLGWLSWNATHRADFNFLPRMGAAEWIVYPTPAQGKPHPRVELSAVFRCGFLLEKPPARATLQAAGFHGYTIFINGKPLAQPLHRGRNWKQPDSYDVSNVLLAGQNEIVATVLNTNGPPALWVSLNADAVRLTTCEAWESSLAGAAWRNAQLATQPKAVIPGSQLYGGLSVWDGFQARWRVLLLFAIVSASVFWFQKKLFLGPRASSANTPPAIKSQNPWLEALPLLGLIAAWLALFANNVTVLPEMYGFDVTGHLDYVRYLMEKNSLPLADEGFEMFQPPLYYALCAGLLKVLHLSISQPGGVMALRLLGMTIGIAHFLIVWLSLRLLFPGERAKARWGVILAAFLPPLLYLSHYVTNEAFAAALVSGCVCLTLHILKQEHLSWKLCAALGLCLGAALLAKFTAVFAVPPIVGALLWRWLEKRDRSLPMNLSLSPSEGERAGVRGPFSRPEFDGSKREMPFWRTLSHCAARLAVVFAACALVCGFHYGRTWLHFGTPLMGNWDPKTGFSYWQDDGFRTSASFLRFGKVLFQPWFSGSNSVADGIYSTLWGDGLLGGTALVGYRPPWSYDFMAIGYWLALVPTLLVLTGGMIAVRKFLRQPSPQWFLLLGLAFLAMLALVHGCLLWPSNGTAKAFYALPALVPFCALGAWGFDAVQRRFAALRPVLVISLSVWALNTVASFRISHSSSSTLVAQVKSLRDQGQYAPAISALKERVKSQPQNADLSALLVDTLLRAGAYAEAGKEAKILLQQKPQETSAHYGSMMALAAQQQFPEAADHGWKALETAPGEVEIYEQLSKVLVRQGNYGEAARVAREGLGMDPFSADLRCVLGTALMAREENSEAIAQLELASALKPDWVAPHGLLGGIFTAQNKLDAAATHYSLAVELDSKNPAPHVDLGKVLALQGKFREATNHLHEALRLEPHNEQAALELSAVLAQKISEE